MRRPRPLHVCLLARNAYPVIDPAAAGSFGGTETRAWQFAVGLARLPGFRVTFAVETRGRIRYRRRQRVRIVNRRSWLKDLRSDFSEYVDVVARPPWLRVRRWRPSLAWQIPLLAGLKLVRRGPPPDPLEATRYYGRIDADVYCGFGVNTESVELVRYAREAGRPSVLMLGMNEDVDICNATGLDDAFFDGLPASSRRNALATADAIVVQSEYQEHALREQFGRDGVLIRNPIDLKAWDDTTRKVLRPSGMAGLDRYVLWIGRTKTLHKRPQLCLDLARRCPDLPFMMLLDSEDPREVDTFRRSAPANIRVAERLPFQAMPAMYSSAAAYLNTSSSEGFPNALLQAWASRIPAASLTVLPELIREVGGGFAADDDLDRLATYLREIWSDRERAAREGARGREYVERHHDAEGRTAELARLLRSVSERAAPAA